MRRGLAARVSLPRWVVGIIAMLVLGAPAVYAVQSFKTDLQNYADGASAKAEQVALELCQRGNLQRSYELANHSDGAKRLKLVEDLQPIIWCQPADDDIILAPFNVQHEYVERVVNDRCWPSLSYDLPVRIVSCSPLPSDSQKESKPSEKVSE